MMYVTERVETIRLLFLFNCRLQSKKGNRFAFSSRLKSEKGKRFTFSSRPGQFSPTAAKEDICDGENRNDSSTLSFQLSVEVGERGSVTLFRCI